MNDQAYSSRVLSVLLAVLMALPIQLWAAGEPAFPDPGNVAGATPQQQQQLGLQTMGEVYQQMPVLPDSSPITQYVQQLGRKLETVIPREHSWPYQFHVVPQKEINAFALPGGPIFINAGTILAADNEAELAGVMAHEMSHVYMQHSVKQQKKDTLPSIVAGAGSILGEMLGGSLGQIVQAGSQGGASLWAMKYSRTDEAQADWVGAIIMYKAGYNPQALSDFFGKLEQQGGQPPKWLSDHPNPGDREGNIQKEIKDWPAKSWLGSSSQFASARDLTKGVRLYTAQEIDANAKQGIWAKQNARQGAVPPNAPAAITPTNASAVINPQSIRVSGKFAQAQRTGYRISYPDNWQALGNQQSVAMTLVPPGGYSQDAIAYGVVIDQFTPPNANEPLSQATLDLVRSVEQQSSGLEAMNDPQDITVASRHGRSVELRGTSPVQRNGHPDAERDWLVAVPQSGGRLLYLIFVAPEPDFTRLRPTFEQMLKSLRLQ